MGAMPAFAHADDDRAAAPVDAAALEAPAPAPGGEALYLQVTLNRTDTGRLARFFLLDGRLHADVAALRGIGFTMSGRAADERIALDAIPGLAVRYDAALQRISLDAPLSLLSLRTRQLNRPDARAPGAAGASPGALLNYDFYGSQQRGAGNLAATAELRVFGVGDGVFSTSALSRAYREAGSGWRGESVRLDTSWQLSFPDRAVTLVVGDGFSGFMDWTRAVRLGGVQLGRDFALQPYRVTTPLPAFLGEAAVPSSVDLYVNGLRQYSGEVPAGPFQLATVPGIDGLGNATVVVTDAYGRVRSIDFPFYASQRLLARGLSDWSVGLGVVREDYGLRSFAYGSDPVATANLRYGVSDRFTLEAHAEGGGGLANAGLGGQWLLGRAGVVAGSYARSRGAGPGGGQAALAYSWNNRRFNLSVASQRTHGEYRDVASLYGMPPARVSDRALAGVVLPGLGNLGASYVRLDYPGQARSRYAGLFWSRTFARRWSANASFNQNLDDRGDRSAYLGIGYAFDDRRQASVSLQRAGARDNAVADVSRPLPGDGDLERAWGWRVQARAGDDGAGGLAEVGWISPAGRYGAGVAGLDGHSYAYASASGSLAWMQGRAFAARAIDDAFAVVSTDGRAGVPVKLENRLVGRTGQDGLLLVSPLRAWQDNRLSIDPLDLPADLRIERVEAMARPRDRSGVAVRFRMAPVRAALLVLHDGAGRPLPLGSLVHVPGTEEPAMVGYDGETWLEALGAHNRLWIDLPEGERCRVEFDYPESASPVPRIGPLACRPDRSP